MAIRRLSSSSSRPNGTMTSAGRFRRASVLLFHGAALLSICMSTSHQSNASAARPVRPHRPSEAMPTTSWPAGYSEYTPMMVDAGSVTGKASSSTDTRVVSGDAAAVQGRDVISANGNHKVDINSKGFRKVVLYSAVVVGWCLTLVVAKVLFNVMNLAIPHVPSAGRGAAQEAGEMDAQAGARVSLEIVSSLGQWLYETGYGGLSSNLSSSDLLYAFVSAVSLVLGFFMKMASNIGHIIAVRGSALSTSELTVALMIYTIIYFCVALGTIGVLSG